MLGQKLILEEDNKIDKSLVKMRESIAFKFRSFKLYGYLFYFFFVMVVLGFELKASHLLSLSHVSSPYFALVIFQIGSHVFSPGLASHVAGTTDVHHHSQFIG
jgi:hypothetical protein